MADTSLLDKSLADLTKMKVADLKNELKQRGLPIMGNKTELIDRLQKSIQEELEEDAVLNDDEEIEELAVESLPKTTEKPKQKTAPIAESTPAKPVSLKRNNAIIEEKKVVEPEKNKEEKKEAPVKELETPKPSEESEEPKKKVVKLSDIGVKERLEMRAKKFGLPLSETAKKEARLERFNSNGTSSDSKSISTNGSVASLEVLKKRAERFGASVSSLMDKADQLERIEKRKARFGEVQPIRELNNKIKIVK